MRKPWANSHKICCYMHALKDDQAIQFALLVDAHDTILQASPQMAVSLLYSLAGSDRIIVEDESHTKIQADAYAGGLRWSDAMTVARMSGSRVKLTRRPWARDALPDPKLNFDLGVACGQSGFKHNTGGLLGPRSLMLDLMRSLMQLNESSDQRALGLLAARDPARWCPRFYLSQSLAFWHVGESPPIHEVPSDPPKEEAIRCVRWLPRNATPLLVHMTRGQAKWLKLNRERFFAERIALWERRGDCGNAAAPDEPSRAGGSGDSFHMVISTFDRDRALRTLLSRYMGCSRVGWLDVIWNDSRRSPPPWLVAMARSSLSSGRRVLLRVLKQPESNLTNRFAAVVAAPLAGSSPSDAIFSLDDDVLYTCDTLRAAHDAFLWLRRQAAMATTLAHGPHAAVAGGAVGSREHPRGPQEMVSPMVGFAARQLHLHGRPSYVWNEAYQPGRAFYNSIFVTKGGLVERRLLHHFLEPRWRQVRALVDELNTGEDLLLSAVHYCLHHKLPPPSPAPLLSPSRQGSRGELPSSAVQAALLAVAAPGERVPTGRSACTPAAGASDAPATAATAVAEVQHYAEIDNDVNPLSKRSAGARGARVFGSYAAGSARIAVLKAIKAELTPAELRGWSSLRLRSWWRWSLGQTHSQVPGAGSKESGAPRCWI